MTDHVKILLDHKIVAKMGKSLGYAPSTISGWQKDGPPATVLRAITRIIELEMQLETAKRHAADLEIVIERLVLKLADK